MQLLLLLLVCLSVTSLQEPARGSIVFWVTCLRGFVCCEPVNV